MMKWEEVGEAGPPWINIWSWVVAVLLTHLVFKQIPCWNWLVSLKWGYQLFHLVLFCNVQEFPLFFIFKISNYSFWIFFFHFLTDFLKYGIFLDLPALFWTIGYHPFQDTIYIYYLGTLNHPDILQLMLLFGFAANVRLKTMSKKTMQSFV